MANGFLENANLEKAVLHFNGPEIQQKKAFMAPDFCHIMDSCEKKLVTDGISHYPTIFGRFKPKFLLNHCPIIWPCLGFPSAFRLKLVLQLLYETLTAYNFLHFPAFQTTVFSLTSTFPPRFQVYNIPRDGSNEVPLGTLLFVPDLYTRLR